MITIYGKKQSRALRVFWTCEELGLPYTQVPIDHLSPAMRSEEHLARNPMGKVPVMVEGDFVLTESVAITQYLASRAPSALWPASPEAQARLWQWTSWATTEVEYYGTQAVREARKPEPNQALILACVESMAETLVAFEQWLGDNAYVAGDAFSVGDINVFLSIMAAAMKLEMSAFPNIAAWMGRCKGREALGRALALDESAAAAA